MNNERSLAKEITEGFEALKSMRNNEPVAWLIQAKIWHEFTFSKPAEDSEDVVITALYTHPVKELTITFDDCIAASLEQDVGYGGDLDLLEFAKAILRKAQEK
jgi:hypothetical protein